MLSLRRALRFMGRLIMLSGYESTVGAQADRAERKALARFGCDRKR